MNENKGFFAKLKEFFAKLFGTNAPKQLEEGPKTVEDQIASAQEKAIEEQNAESSIPPAPEVNPLPGMESNVQEFANNQDMSARDAMSQEMSLDDILGPEENVDTIEETPVTEEAVVEEPKAIDETEIVTAEEAIEEDDLLRLQQMFSDGAIEEDELTTEQVQKLHALYDEQIADLQNQIEKNRAATEDYKRKIIEIKRQLKTA